MTRLLIADDDADNRDIAKDALEAAGYDIDLAKNGEEALEMALKLKPPLILLDLSMSKLSGWEVATRIRQVPSMSETVIIAFTAHALAGAELKAKAAGCDDYIAKPCSPQEMVLKINYWLKQKVSESAA